MKFFRNARIGTLVLHAALLVHSFSVFATVRINEIMASNSETIADEDGDFEDWIELHNGGDSPVSLNGYGLSDDEAEPFGWVFPDISIQPGEFVLVFASSKDRNVAGGELHTSFAIASDGETLFFTDPAGQRVDEIETGAIPRDFSFGRVPEGAGDWFLFAQPTPGESNSSPVVGETLEPPVFSRPPGFYTDAFELEIFSDQEGVTIRYTLDGSTPDANSPAYSGPIHIGSREGEPNTISLIRSGPPGDWSQWREPSGEVFKSTVIRAGAFREGALPSAPSTSTYFVDSAIHERYQVPIISLTTDPKNFFSDETGIYVPGALYDGENWHTGNYFQRGDEWERPVHVALFDALGVPRLSQDAGVRIHGGTTRRFSPKGLRLYARSRYGKDAFSYPIFEDHHTEVFSRLILRTSGNDFSTSLFRDAMMQRLVEGVGLDQQAYQSSVVFINGEYWGIHEIRERVDEFYLNRRYGVDPEKLDMLYDNHSVTLGDSEHYEAMLSFLGSNDMADAAAYAHVQTLMDTDNFAAYMAAQIYFANTDWPNGNIEYWRSRADGYRPDLPYGHDGRWRWILYDTDHGFGFGKGSTYSHNTLKLATADAPEWSTFLLRTLLENESFRTDFINIQADFLNTIFKSDRVVETIEEMRDELEPLMEEHIARWGYPRSIDGWRSHIRDVMIMFARNRAEFVREHIVDHFNLGGIATITVDVPRDFAGTVRINSVVIDGNTPGVANPTAPYPWTGVYFEGVPVEIEALPAPGYAFDGWGGISNGSATSTVLELSGNISISANFRALPGSGGSGCAMNKVLTSDFLKDYIGDLFLLSLVASVLVAWTALRHRTRI